MKDIYVQLELYDGSFIRGRVDTSELSEFKKKQRHSMLMHLESKTIIISQLSVKDIEALED